MDFVREHTTNRPCVPLWLSVLPVVKLLPLPRNSRRGQARMSRGTSSRRDRTSTLVTLPRPPRRSRISRVRAFVLILVLLPALPAPADVIHLKNGRTISADQVRESKDKERVEYDLGDDTYAIPKSSVERIDAGGAVPGHAGSGGSANSLTPHYTHPG